MKSQFVKDLRLGDQIEDLFVVSRISVGYYDRGEYLRLRLADSTGKISAVMWQGATEAYESVRSGDLARVEGRVEAYRGELQLKVVYLSRIDSYEDLNPEDFLPKSRFSSTELIERLRQFVDEIRNEYCRNILEVFLADEEFQNLFRRAPGGKMWHHAVIGGLLEHTLWVTGLCRAIAPFYPKIDRDLLTTGAVLHDIGKVQELRYDIAFDYTNQGRLLGHVILGDELLRRYAAQVEGFPDELLMRLRHMLISHHGDIERSPVLPMTLEASLLHYIDNLDAQINASIREMEKSSDPTREWTDYVNLLGRSLFTKPIPRWHAPDSDGEPDNGRTDRAEVDNGEIETELPD
ncbi:MAG TPA: HD domain-containing protein [bacterium]|nr:HD domain-containing protein [bacterium]HQL63681.1 HD domain-containing protein [bacterium]